MIAYSDNPLFNFDYGYRDYYIIDAILQSYDKDVAIFAKAFCQSAQLADDVMDRRLNVNYVLDSSIQIYKAMSVAPKELLIKLDAAMAKLFIAEKCNQTFVPGQFSNEQELEVVKGRTTLPVYFECLCYVDPTFDTKENRGWIEEYYLECLKNNDARDILSGCYEDFICCRRNYVALTCFDYTIYDTWRERKEELVLKAQEVKDNIKFSEPKDIRLKMFLGGN